MPDRPRSTSIRPLAKILESSQHPAWLMDADGKLIYLSAACQEWLGIACEKMLGRSTCNSSTPTDDLSTQMALSLAAPAGLSERGHIVHTVQPLPERGVDEKRPSEPRTTLFVAVSGSSVLALTDPVYSNPIQQETQVALRIRQVLDHWRASQPTFDRLPLTMGNSPEAIRLRGQLRIAESTLASLAFIGSDSYSSQVIATAIHYGSVSKRPLNRSKLNPNASSPLIVISGPLMDSELLEATISPAINWLTERSDHQATLLVCDVDQTPQEVQSQLDRLADQYAERLRIMVHSSYDFTQDNVGNAVYPPLAAKTGLFSITIPGLSDRSDDIPLIASAILAQRRAIDSCSAEQFSRAALDALVMYPWPEHYSELVATIRHAARHCSGPSIQPEHLPLSIRSYRPSNPNAANPPLSIDLDHALRQMERQLIQRAVEEANGNRAQAARMLNISRPRLLRRLTESIDPEKIS